MMKFVVNPWKELAFQMAINLAFALLLIGLTRLFY